MDGIVVLVLIIAGLVLLDVLAWRFGVDSRIGFEDPAAPARDLSV